MSFILDALKKSDAERQQRSTPGFADIPVSRDRREPPRWLWLVGGLLVVNLVAVVVLLVRPEPEPAVVEEPAAEPVAPAPARATNRPFADIVAEARQRQPQTEKPASSRREPPPGDAAAQNAAGNQPASGAPPDAATNTAASEPAEEPANTFESLRADGTLQLPDLHLDIHVFSEQPAERFVFVNTKKYRESETLAEGPRVRRIAPEGVILEHRGTVFLLPRE